MKVLISGATPYRPGDFTFTRPGELLSLPGPCDCCGTCGCAREFSGIETREATTTAIVATAPDLTLGELAMQLLTSCRAAAIFPDPRAIPADLADFYRSYDMGGILTEDGQWRLAWEDAELIAASAARFDAGTVLEVGPGGQPRGRSRQAGARVLQSRALVRRPAGEVSRRRSQRHRRRNGRAA